MQNKELKERIDVEVLRQHYGLPAAMAIDEYIADFIDYLNNFNPVSYSFRGTSEQCPLVLDCPIHVSSSSVTGAQLDGALCVLYVEVLFPQEFPSLSPICRVLAHRCSTGSVASWSISRHSKIVTPEGLVRLENISQLAGASSPYTLFDILMALIENFSQEFPLVPSSTLAEGGEGSPRPCAPPGVVMRTPMSNERAALLQRAGETVMAHLFTKADEYLHTRVRVLKYQDILNRSCEQLHEAEVSLRNKKSELLKYSPCIGRVEELVEALGHVPNSLEEHSMCIVPVDELQARALDLLGEIRACDDVLELLERALKLGQISCDEFVRRVSDVGREQFVARFIFGRVTEAINHTAGGGHITPSLQEPPQEPTEVSAPLLSMRPNFQLWNCCVRSSLMLGRKWLRQL
ncbi:Vps23 core domain [Trypanosoma vivax]|nr:Vps23 core domain [Trypanosoma vivax]